MSGDLRIPTGTDSVSGVGTLANVKAQHAPPDDLTDLAVRRLNRTFAACARVRSAGGWLHLADYHESWLRFAPAGDDGRQRNPSVPVRRNPCRADGNLVARLGLKRLGWLIEPSIPVAGAY